MDILVQSGQNILCCWHYNLARMLERVIQYKGRHLEKEQGMYILSLNNKVHVNLQLPKLKLNSMV
jgi:hypothetical protein